MQQRSLVQGRSARGAAHQPRRVQPFTAARCHPCVRAAASNGNGHVAVAKTPSPAQTIRTIVDISHEGTLCSVSASGHPVGVPVGVVVDKQGHVKVHIGAGAMQVANLHASATCSLTIQPTAAPARSVAAVTLIGSVDASAADGGELPMSLHKCIYFGGLDQAKQGQEVAAEDYLAAEPDVLRKAAAELVHNFNNDRAEDLYRIVSDFLKIPLTDMEYVELLWIDYLGMYVRAEVAGKEQSVLRVPFYRPVLDERDARSVITMAAQLAWERERNYTPPLPSIFADAAGAASNN